MRNFRLFTVVALLILPSIFASNPGYSASQLPGINTMGPIQQQNCPTGKPYGCFNPGIQQAGGNVAINAGFANTTSYQYTPFNPCMQFMQIFLRLGAGPS